MLKYTITQKNKARGDSTWYGRMFNTETKETKFISLGTTLKKLADEWLRKQIADAVSGVRHNDGLTIEQAMNEYLKNFKGTKACYNTMFKIMRVFAADRGATLFKDINTMFALDLFASFAQLKATTRKMRVTILRTWWRWCAKVYGIKGIENPFDMVKVEKPEPSDRSYWSVSQLEQILEAAPTKDERLCYAFMGYAGLRIHEAIKVQGNDIVNGKLHVVGKGKKFATIPISTRLQKELKMYGELPEGTIIKKMAMKTWQYRLHSLFERNGFDFGGRVHLHRFRHSFASNLAINGCGLMQLMKLMRHSSITMTQRYVHLMPDDLETAVNLF